MKHPHRLRFQLSDVAMHRVRMDTDATALKKRLCHLMVLVILFSCLFHSGHVQASQSGNVLPRKDLLRLAPGKVLEYSIVAEESVRAQDLRMVYSLSLHINSIEDNVAICSLRLLKVLRNGSEDIRMRKRSEGQFYIDTTIDAAGEFDPKMPIGAPQRRLLTLAYPVVRGIDAKEGSSWLVNMPQLGIEMVCMVQKKNISDGILEVHMKGGSKEDATGCLSVKGQGDFSLDGGYWKKVVMSYSDPASNEAQPVVDGTLKVSLTGVDELTPDRLKLAKRELSARRAISAAYDLLNDGHPEQAVARIGTATVDFKGTDHVEFHAAAICFHAGQLDDAEKYIGKELEGNPQFYPAVSAACEVYRQLGRQEKVDELTARMRGLEEQPEKP